MGEVVCYCLALLCLLGLKSSVFCYCERLGLKSIFGKNIYTQSKLKGNNAQLIYDTD